MQEKLKFFLVYASGEDENHPASELTVQTPYSQGWLSPRLCEYPQEIGIQFEGIVRIERIQFLSHENKIATKIELFIGEAPAANDGELDSNPNYENCVFRRLGYLSFDSNRQTEFKARELKTVNIDATGCFMKLLIHKCHINNHNLYNQVGIVGIRFIGELKEPFSPRLLPPAGLKAENNTNQVDLKDMKPKPDREDEAEIIFDAATLAKIKEYQLFKDRAVQNEDFAEAKRYKEAIDNLKRRCAKLIELENQKKIAVDKEDYDRAMILKEEINRLRNADDMISSRASSASSRLSSAPKKLEPIQPTAGGANTNRAHRTPTFPGALGPSGVSIEEIADESPADFSEQPVQHSGRLRQEAGRTRRAPSPQDSSVDQVEEEQDQDQHYNDNDGDNNINNNDSRSPSQDEGVSHDEKMVKGMKFNELFNDESKWKQLEQAVAPKKPVPRHQPKNRDEMHVVVVDGGGNSFPSPDSSSFIPSKDTRPAWERSLITAIQQSNDTAPDPFDAKTKKAIDADLLRGLIDTYGEYTAKCLFSKPWQLRETAITVITNQLGKLPHKPQSIFTVSCSLISIAMGDKIEMVFLASLNLLRQLLVVPDSIGKSLPKNVVQNSLMPIIEILVNKMAESNAKVKDACMQMLMDLAAEKAIGCGLIANRVIKTAGKKIAGANAWKPIVARLQMLQQLIAKYKLSPSSGMTADSVMEYVVGALQNPNGEARSAAIKVTSEVYRIKGAVEVEPHLQDLKPALKEQIDAECQKAAARDAGNDGADGEEEAYDATTPVSAPVKSGRGGPTGARKDSASTNAKKGAPQQANKDDDNKVMDDEPEEMKATCHYCGQHNPAWEDSVMLDLHMLKECPFLLQCPFCDNAVEVPEFTNHQLTECSSKDMFKQCARCKEAIHVDKYDKHVAAKQCLPVKEKRVSQRCPLCHEDIPPGPKGWTRHLIVEGCPNNQRSRIDDIDGDEEVDQPRSQHHSSQQSQKPPAVVAKVSRRVFSADDDEEEAVSPTTPKPAAAVAEKATKSNNANSKQQQQQQQQPPQRKKLTEQEEMKMYERKHKAKR